MKQAIWILSVCLFPYAGLLGQSFKSFYSDAKGHDVGDILSVMVVENANASRESKSNNSSKADWGTQGSLTGDVTKLTPKLGISSAWENSYDGKEGTEQKEHLSGRLAVRIVEKTTSGMFKIKGQRKLGVNGSTNIMKLTGYVRPQDINANNTIYSYHIADAKITYKKTGLINAMMKQGGFTRLFSKVMGLGILVISLGFFSLKTLGGDGAA